MSARTRFLFAALFLAVIGGLWLLILESRPDHRHPASSDAGQAQAISPSATAAGERRHLESEDRWPFLLAGSVRDETGNAIPGIDVVVAAREDPFGETPLEARVIEGELVGRSVRTDAGGAFSIRLPTDQEVFVRADPRPEDPYRADSALVSSIWVAPASDVRLALRSAPMTTLRVRLVTDSGAPVQDKFLVSIRGERWGVSTIPGRAGLAETSAPLGRAGIVEISLAKPKASARPMKLHIDPGGSYEVTLTLSGESVFSGIVQDERDSPISNARVYIGSSSDASDELLDVFDSSSTIGSVTDQGGRFLFRGPNSGVLTAEHSDFCSKTVAAADSRLIILAARAELSILSTQRDLSVLPVILNEKAVRVSKSGDYYRIDRIGGGRQILDVPGLGQFVLSIECGKSESLDLDACIDMSIRLECDGRPYSQPRKGVLWGLGKGFSLVRFELVDGTLNASGVLPGAYVMAFEGGGMVEFEVAPSLTLDVGSSRLRVYAPPGAVVATLPGKFGGNKELNHLAQRASMKVPAAGFVDFWPMCRETWHLFLDGSHTPRVVVIEEVEESVTLE